MSFSRVSFWMTLSDLAKYSSETKHHTASATAEFPVLISVLSSLRLGLLFECGVMWIHGLAPSYLASHCRPTSSCPGRSHLRSATFGQLNFLRMKTDYGKRRFAVNGPVVWNSLPAELRSPDISLDVFKARLKTFLFNCCVFYSDFALY